MTTATAKKANRGHLLRAAKAQRLFVKCSFHMTDDYAHDNANGFGKMDAFKQVYLRQPHASPLEARIDGMYANGATHKEVEPLMEALRREWGAHADQERKNAEGKLMLATRDFRTKSGHIHGDTKRGSFGVHSNLNYEYEIR